MQVQSKSPARSYPQAAESRRGCFPKGAGMVLLNTAAAIPDMERRAA
ncbi:MAG: hypothetical protein ABIW76_13445 [Fibrobacteria bacterium]